MLCPQSVDFQRLQISILFMRNILKCCFFINGSRPYWLQMVIVLVDNAIKIHYHFIHLLVEMLFYVAYHAQ